MNATEIYPGIPSESSAGIILDIHPRFFFRNSSRNCIEIVVRILVTISEGIPDEILEDCLTKNADEATADSQKEFFNIF